MKNKPGLTLAIMFLLVAMLACNITSGSNNIGETKVQGSGNQIEETRPISDVSRVELAMQGTLHLTLGSSESLLIEAEDNLMPYIETKVSGGRLVIKSQEGIDLQPTRSIGYYLTVAKLNTLAISSSGDIETGDLVSGSFSITISSSGD